MFHNNVLLSCTTFFGKVSIAKYFIVSYCVLIIYLSLSTDYSKDLLSYLKHCKDVVYANITKSYEEEKLIERLWDMYEKQEV